MNAFIIGGALAIIGAIAWYAWYTRHEEKR